MFGIIENHGRTGTFAHTGTRYGLRYDVGFDFNILTAFIRLGRAGPVGAGCPPYYYLTLLVERLILYLHYAGSLRNGV